MKTKKIVLKKKIITNLVPAEMKTIKGGFDLEDYAVTYRNTSSQC